MVLVVVVVLVVLVILVVLLILVVILVLVVLVVLVVPVVLLVPKKPPRFFLFFRNPLSKERIRFLSLGFDGVSEVLGFY